MVESRGPAVTRKGHFARYCINPIIKKLHKEVQTSDPNTIILYIINCNTGIGDFVAM